MLKVKNIGSNKTEVETKETIVLVSYSTPVACIIRDIDYKFHVYKTSQFWSVTTSKHINQWLREKGHNPDKVETKPQSFFDDLLE